MKTVLLLLGTRAEAIKLAPVVREMRRSAALRPVVAVSGQHPALLAGALEAFGIAPEHDLGLWRPDHTLNSVVAGVLDRLPPLLRALRPAAVVVQGDTGTALGGALAAFNEGVPVAHVEAGLRTADERFPFPEEMNRRLISRMARLHLAPTVRCARNLLSEGVPRSRVAVTGNPVVDALREIRRRAPAFADPTLREWARGEHRIVVVTMHRRESWGAPSAGVAAAVAALAGAFPEARFVLPLHDNPRIRAAFAPPLASLGNVLLLPPLDYPQMVALIGRAYLVLTDSGGIQEEAPALGTPVLVLREETERVEAVETGAARLVGCAPERVFLAARSLMCDSAVHARMARARSPFGDGRAARRIVAALSRMLDEGPAGHDALPPVMAGAS